VIELPRRIAENVDRVRRRIAEAAARAGRSPDDVRLLAATKYVGPDEIRALVAAGCVLLGENRPQDLCQKAESLHDVPIEWHMIGHLQRNKVRRVLPWVAMVQSVDSERLLAAIDRIAGDLGRSAPVLLEVNVSRELQKHGLAPEELPAVIASLPAYPHVEVRGLMTMASLVGGADAARRDFAALRALRDQVVAECPPGVPLTELSMGTTADFEIAIEEGATIVRIGLALYEEPSP
jgi:PLP dependent protein